MGLTNFPNGVSVNDEGTPLSLADLADVEITDLRDGDILVYDEGDGVWVNRPAG